MQVDSSNKPIKTGPVFQTN